MVDVLTDFGSIVVILHVAVIFFPAMVPSATILETSLNQLSTISEETLIQIGSSLFWKSNRFVPVATLSLDRGVQRIEVSRMRS